MPLIKVVINKKNNTFLGDLLGNNKFYADTFKYEDINFFLIMNGVNYVFDKLHTRDNVALVLDYYQRYGDTFCQKFRGPFSGLLYDKQVNKWLVFTNHTGEQKLFYCDLPHYLIICSDLYELNNTIQELGQKATLDLDSAYFLLTYGYMLSNSTLITEVKRLTAGSYFVYQKGKLAVNKYYKLDNTPRNKISQVDAIKLIDNSFKKAVRLEYDKDRLYGFRHLSPLSGGLDCRMTNWVANYLGYTPTTNYTYSQSGYLDMKIAQDLSNHLGNEWKFIDLEQGQFLYDLDNAVKIANACFRSTVRNSVVKSIDFSQYGLIHSGQLGDAILSSHCPQTGYDTTKKVKLTSHILKNRIESKFLTQPNDELANIEVRGLNGMLSGNFTFQPYTQVASPFTDPDFMDLALSLPLDMRAYHKIYKQWIITKYPDASRFKWENINAKITQKTINIRGKIVPLSQFPKFILHGILYNLGININQGSKLENTNPFDYWYNHNEKLKKFIDLYYQEHLDVINNPVLKEDVSLVFNKGKMADKLQVLTLLSAVKEMKLQN